MQISATISQLLIYNTCPGTRHARQTSTKSMGRSRNNLSSLSRSDDAQGSMAEKQIETTHALGLSVSYSRVMEVKQVIARVVCEHYAQDGVVLPTNLRTSVFASYDVDNLDGQNKGNFSQGGFHGTALGVTNHLSWDNLRKKSVSMAHQLQSCHIHMQRSPCLAGRVHYTLCTLEWQ